MTKRVVEENIVLLHCIDKKSEILYITAELEEQSLVLRYSHHIIGKSGREDYIYKFTSQSTEQFQKLISGTRFLESLKEKYHTANALEEISKFADKNNLKYEVYNHYNYDEYDMQRYNLIDFYDDEEPERLYYEDGSFIIPNMFHHPKEGICKIYTDEGDLYMKISYKNNLKNGLTSIYWGYSGEPVLHYERTYKNDILYTVKTYYSDGAFKEKAQYNKGKRKIVDKKEGWHVDDWYAY